MRPSAAPAAPSACSSAGGCAGGGDCGCGCRVAPRHSRRPANDQTAPTWQPAGELPPGIHVSEAEWAALTDDQKKAMVAAVVANGVGTTQDRTEAIARLVAEGIQGVTTLINQFLDRETARLRTEAEREAARDALRNQIEIAKIQAERDVRIAQYNANNSPPPTTPPATQTAPPAVQPAAPVSATTVVAGISLLAVLGAVAVAMGKS